MCIINSDSKKWTVVLLCMHCHKLSHRHVCRAVIAEFIHVDAERHVRVILWGFLRFTVGLIQDVTCPLIAMGGVNSCSCCVSEDVPGASWVVDGRGWPSKSLNWLIPMGASTI